MSAAGNIFGIVFGCILAVVFASLFIYSAYKAYVDRKRIIEKNRRIQEDELLAEEHGEAEVPEEEGEEAPDELPMMERKWTQKGVAYRREGAVVHISMKNQQKGEDHELLPQQQAANGSTMQPNGARPTHNNIEVEINGDPSAVPSSANVITNGQDDANASWL